MSRTFCWAVLMVMIGISIVPASTLAQAPAGGGSSELVGLLAKELGSSTKQAQGAAGSLFRLAKTRMAPEDFGKVATAVPGMDGRSKPPPLSTPRRAAPRLSARRWAARGSLAWPASRSRSRSSGSSPTWSRRRSRC